MNDQISKDDLQPIVSLPIMADKVEISLRKYFKSKKFKPGDALPKETELAEALGVSRNVLREALSRLRMLGMIETRKKRGMIMAQLDVLSSFERVLDPYILSESTRKELFELRLVLEMGLADLLFVRKSADHIQLLKDIVEKEKKARREVDRVQLDMEFHAALYRIAGNNFLKRFQKLLLPVFEYVVENETKVKGGHVSGEVNHEELVKILENGSPGEFRNAMYKHLKPHFDHI